MRGLLKKDWELLVGNYKTYGVVAAISLVYLFLGGNSVHFFVAYVTLVAVILVLNTIAYDDFDHGMAFLMTLPIQRETYVLEKYVFGLLCGILGWLISGVLSAARLFYMGAVQNWQELGGIYLTYLWIVVFMLVFMIPIQLKFGGDNGKIVMVGAILLAMAIGAGIGKVLELADVSMDVLFAQMLTEKLPVTVTVLAVMIAAGFWISYRASVRIMKKKEF